MKTIFFTALVVPAHTFNTLSHEIDSFAEGMFTLANGGEGKAFTQMLKLPLMK
jgi:hypothetical protein